jgi:DNA-binding LacI/PurR family transcriptional regulator
VPEDISVVGFDDIPEAPYFTPPLTTVAQPFGDMGRLGFRMLLAEISSGTREEARVTITPELVIRSSTAAPRT